MSSSATFSDEAGFMLRGSGKCTGQFLYHLEPGDAVVIGRHPECTIVVADSSLPCEDLDLISRQHAVVEELNGTWSVHDNGSRNGTAVLFGGLPPAVRLRSGERQTLQPGDVIELAASADFRIVFDRVMSRNGNNDDGIS